MTYVTKSWGKVYSDFFLVNRTPFYTNDCTHKHINRFKFLTHAHIQDHLLNTIAYSSLTTSTVRAFVTNINTISCYSSKCQHNWLWACISYKGSWCWRCKHSICLSSYTKEVENLNDFGYVLKMHSRRVTKQLLAWHHVIESNIKLMKILKINIFCRVLNYVMVIWHYLKKNRFETVVI